MNENKLVSLDDAALDEVNGGAWSFNVSIATPKEIVTGAVGLVKSTVEGAVSFLGSLFSITKG